jgi:tetratricopeptide (TPR) repeat protein
MGRLPIACMAAVAAAMLFVQPAQAEPYVPADDDVVLEHLPLPASQQFQELRALARQLAEQPDDLDLALAVAGHYLDLGRAEGDPRYYGLAQGVLTPWWSLPVPPPRVRLARATVLQSRHDFEGARVDLDAVLAANPANAQALLSRAALREALGDITGAERDCAKVIRLLPGLAGKACLASAFSLSGAARAGYAELSAALADTPMTEPDLRLWALTTLGEIATRLGEPAAEQHFQEGMALGRSVYLLTAYADLLLDQGRDAEVIQLLADETAEPLILRRAIAMRRSDDPVAHDLQRQLAASFAAVRLRGDVPHRRDEARLALQLEDDPFKALQLAQENWEVQHGPADARLLLEAARTASMPEAARPVLAWLAATRIEDVTLARLAEQFAGKGS